MRLIWSWDRPSNVARLMGTVSSNAVMSMERLLLLLSVLRCLCRAILFVGFGAWMFVMCFILSPHSRAIGLIRGEDFCGAGMLFDMDFANLQSVFGKNCFCGCGCNANRIESNATVGRLLCVAKADLIDQIESLNRRTAVAYL